MRYSFLVLLSIVSTSFGSSMRIVPWLVHSGKEFRINLGGGFSRSMGMDTTLFFLSKLQLRMKPLDPVFVIHENPIEEIIAQRVIQNIERLGFKKVLLFRVESKDEDLDVSEMRDLSCAIKFYIPIEYRWRGFGISPLSIEDLKMQAINVWKNDLSILKLISPQNGIIHRSGRIGNR